MSDNIERSHADDWQDLHDSIIELLPQQFRQNSLGAADGVKRLVNAYDEAMQQNHEFRHGHRKAAQPQRSDQLKFIPPPSGAQLTWRETVRESRDQPQEWAIEPARRSTGETWTGLAYINCGGGRLLGSMNEQVALAVIATHNAELAAERQRREQAEHLLNAVRKESNSRLQQILSAQAAIEKHNAHVYQRTYKIENVDLSVLREHDMQDIANTALNGERLQISKDLVELLVESRRLLNKWASRYVEAEHAQKDREASRVAISNIDDALAKISQ